MKRNGLGQIKNAVSIRARPPRSMSIFVILDLPGSAGQTKTPTDCCASIFRVAPICPCTARPSSVLSQGSSMKGRERPCSIRHRLRSSQNVLQRSVELAAQSGKQRRGLFTQHSDNGKHFLVFGRLTERAPLKRHIYWSQQLLLIFYSASERGNHQGNTMIPYLTKVSSGVALDRRVGIRSNEGVMAVR